LEKTINLLSSHAITKGLTRRTTRNSKNSAVPITYDDEDNQEVVAKKLAEFHAARVELRDKVIESVYCCKSKFGKLKIFGELVDFSPQ
jgi:hypothetical protein